MTADTTPMTEPADSVDAWEVVRRVANLTVAGGNPLQDPALSKYPAIADLVEKAQVAMRDHPSVRAVKDRAPAPVGGGKEEDVGKWQDKAEGLEADLRSAVMVAWKRGAHEWCRLNYPQWVEWLEAEHATPPVAPAREEGGAGDLSSIAASLKRIADTMDGTAAGVCISQTVFGGRRDGQ